jgi:hypothetical protein
LTGEQKTWRLEEQHLNKTTLESKTILTVSLRLKRRRIEKASDQRRKWRKEITPTKERETYENEVTDELVRKFCILPHLILRVKRRRTEEEEENEEQKNSKKLKEESINEVT